MWWTTSVILWLFVINLGVVIGAGLYEHRIVLSEWIRTSESGTYWDGETARRADVGKRFWGFVTTIPLTLLTLASLVVAWGVPLPPSAARSWWLAAGFLSLADRVFTFVYFIPTMIGLMRAADTPESVKIATRWRRLNYLRLAIDVAAWLAALRAFASFHGCPASLEVVLRQHS